MSAIRPRLVVCGVLAVGALGGCAAPATTAATNVAQNGSAPAQIADPNGTTGGDGTQPSDDPNAAVDVDPNAATNDPTTGAGTAVDPGAATTAQAPPAATADGMLSMRTVPRMGAVVVDGNGMVLYRFDKDAANPSTSNCVSACASTWPPVIARHGMPATRGIDSKLIGMVRRADGTMQLTVAGWPMYRYSGDRNAGAWTGQARDGTWWAVGSDGRRNMTCIPTTAPSVPAPVNIGGGYNGGNNGGGGAPHHW